MIKANELRIGNKVYFLVENANGERRKMTTSLTPNQIVSIYNNEEVSDFWEPIPLTPEWLERLGFVNSTGVHWCVPHNDFAKSFEICLWSDHVSYCLPNNFHLVISSVHQLQNLYFAHTCEELEIKP